MKVSKTVKNYFWIAILFVMAVAMFMPVKAEAASYKTVTLSSTSKSKKVGNTTFSYKSGSSSYSYRLYAKKSGKATFLGNVSGAFVTNGKTVYYAEHTYNSGDKYTVYSRKVSGSSSKKLFSVKTNYFKLAGYYSGKLYYTKGDSSGKFVQYTVKSGKKKNISKNCIGTQYGKYFLLSPQYESEGGYPSTLKVYNASSGKTKTITKKMWYYTVISNKIYVVEYTDSKKSHTSPVKTNYVRYSMTGKKKTLIKGVTMRYATKLSSSYLKYVDSNGKTKKKTF